MSSVEDHITEPKPECRRSSCLLYRLYTQVIGSELTSITFSVEVLVTGSQELIVTRQVVKAAIVAPMKRIYKFCLVYNCWKNRSFLLPKVVIDHFNGQGLKFVFFVSLKHNFGTPCPFLVKRFY